MAPERILRLRPGAFSFSAMLLRTKFYRPSVPQDLVVRPRLIDKMNQGLNQPLTLICAPAGYGKTMLVSSFLQTCVLPWAWLSLDENDNDLRVFLDYLLSALDSVFPGALHRTRQFLSGTTLPQVSVIADSLINELAELERESILVLDDVHDIHDADIFSLLAALLRRPLPQLHLVLLTRQDPPLGLGMLRARGQVSEIRSRDLRFTPTETAAFMDQAVATPPRDEALAALTEQTEGWAAGLRLAALTVHYGGDIDRQAAGEHAENRYVTDYLVSEVLSRIPPEIEDFLVKTSILETLCGPLCDAVVDPGGVPRRGQAYLQMLEETGLFTVSLDEQRLWYRYHHLFRSLLRSRLTQRLDAHAIDALHNRASAWYAGHDTIELALEHALAGHDVLGAVQLVAQYRHMLLDTEQRPRLERWLARFPGTTLAQHPDLLLAKAWIAELNRADSPAVLSAVDQAQTLIDHLVGSRDRARQLQGEIDTLRGMEKSFTATDPPGVITLTTRALETMPQSWYLARVEAWLHLAGAYQMTGELDPAYAVFAAAQQEDTAGSAAPRARLLAARCFIHWMAADLSGTLRWAQQTVNVGQATDQQRESLGWGHYFLAGCLYQRNDLAAAELHANAVYAQRHACHRITVVQSAILLAAIQQARGNPGAARGALDQVTSYLAEIQSEALLPLVQAFGAELAAVQGDLETAGRWATMVGPRIPLGIMAFLYAPQLTLPKILLRIDTPASRQQAAEVLARLHTFVTATHNTRFTIEVLALQALCYHTQANEPAALQALEQALTFAQPGGFLRVFVDLGPAMAGLLERLRRRAVAPGYIERILNVLPVSPAQPFPPSKQPTPPLDLAEPLSSRELEVLALLAQRLSAKEIAQRLTISDRTAKRHIANIYQKLAVNSRREATAAAIALGLLSAPR